MGQLNATYFLLLFPRFSSLLPLFSALWVTLGRHLRHEPRAAVRQPIAESTHEPSECIERSARADSCQTFPTLGRGLQALPSADHFPFIKPQRRGRVAHASSFRVSFAFIAASVRLLYRGNRLMRVFGCVFRPQQNRSFVSLWQNQQCFSSNKCGFSFISSRSGNSSITHSGYVDIPTPSRAWLRDTKILTQRSPTDQKNLTSMFRQLARRARTFIARRNSSGIYLTRQFDEVAETVDDFSLALVLIQCGTRARGPTTAPNTPRTDQS